MKKKKKQKHTPESRQKISDGMKASHARRKAEAECALLTDWRATNESMRPQEWNPVLMEISKGEYPRLIDSLYTRIKTTLKDFLSRVGL